MGYDQCGLNLFYGANPTFIVTNDSVRHRRLTVPTTVAGTYFYQTTGQNCYNNIVVDFTGIPGVDNNPNFRHSHRECRNGIGLCGL